MVKRYGDLTAVDGLDLEVERGTCLGLLGPNGAGKTTTIEMLEGLKRPDAGELAILGLDWQRDARAIRAAIGVQLQETDLLAKLTVAETVRMFRAFYTDTRTIDEVLDIIGLQEKRDARVDDLSGGQKQRLALGCAMVHRPEILFLDEPTTGLDPQARRRMWEVIEDFLAGGGTVLLTTHYMEEAERLSQRVLIVDHGRAIASGTPREVIESLGAENIVELGLGDQDGQPDDATLLALPGVASVTSDNGHLRLSVTDTQACLAALLALLDARGLAVEDLRTHRPTLEDVFVALTGKHLRDG
ncbi:MAG TPA: ABC transporter ATP-binding protein [Planctomycetota bacterium]|nr:ABC transporter ATP-binding protein [Planctomycetota bacterium]